MTFKVQVEPSGHEFTVGEGETILDAALEHGLAFPYGCRNGACGNCLGRLISGQIEYKDGEPSAMNAEDRDMVVFCQAIPRSDCVVQVDEVEAKAIPVRTTPAKVARMERPTDDIMVLRLSLPEAVRLQFRAGQYLNILLKDGRKRAFSIANAPHRDQYIELHLRRVKGGVFTNYVFNEMQPKEILRIEGPHGSFYLREDSRRPMLLLATGTGIAPIKAIIEHALAEGIERPMHLYWGGRFPSDFYLDAELRRLADTHANFSYTPICSQGANDWTGRIGHVQDAALADFPDLNGFEVYACGLPAMVYAARDALVAQGLDPAHYYSDAFEFAKE